MCVMVCLPYQHHMIESYHTAMHVLRYELIRLCSKPNPRGGFTSRASDAFIVGIRWRAWLALRGCR